MTRTKDIGMGAASAKERPTKERFCVLTLLFIAIAINYVDRTNLAVTAPVLQKELNINPAVMGLIFSAFSWIYMALQVPSGFVLDRFGTRKTLGFAVFLWSGCTFMFGFASKVIHLIILRLALGITEAPCIPSAQRSVAAWFPRGERGMAVGIYTAGQYVGLAFLMPAMTWLVTTHGWQSIFWITGGLGMFYALYWLMVYREPGESKHINQAELDYLRAGGAATDLAAAEPMKFHWATLGKIVAKRELWGLFGAKFGFSSVLWFFFTWFPSYLVHEKHMTLMQVGWYSMLPFACAMAGIVLGGIWSDSMSRRGVSHTRARKLPVILGLALTICIIGGKYVDAPLLVLALMSVVFFGLGMANGLDALMCDTAPTEAFGATVGVCQMCANFGGAITPMVVGFIVQATGSYAGGIAYVSANAILGVISVTFIIKKVERITL